MLRRLIHSPWLPSLTAICAVIFVGILLLPLESPPGIDDGLRHFTIARRMAEHGISSFHGWGDVLFAGYFRLHNSDPWFLSDIFFIPFTRFGLVTGLKWIIVISSLLLVISFLALLRSARTPAFLSALAIVLLFAGNSEFFGRLFFARPFVLMTCVELCVVAAILNKRWWIVPPIMTIATLLSHLFIFPLVTCVLGVVWLRTLQERRSACLLSLGAFGGVLLGFALHPQASAYFHYLVTAFIRIPFLRGLFSGMELSNGFVSGSIFLQPLVGFLILLTVEAVRSGTPLAELNRRGVTFTLANAAMFFALYLHWMRTIDFFWPLILFACMHLIAVNPSALPALERDIVGKFRSLNNHLVRRFLTLVIAALCTINVLGVAWSLRASRNAHTFSPLAALASLPPSARVLNFDWDTFPRLFALRPDLTFALGMDPAFTALSDPRAADLLPSIRSSRQELMKCKKFDACLSELLGRFPEAEFIVLDTNRHAALLPKLITSRWVKPLRIEGEIGIFEILKK
ncbi:MAG: hypothetical protein V1926_02690 [Candidatus Peregrinibacteria bacterium]